MKEAAALKMVREMRGLLKNLETLDDELIAVAALTERAEYLGGVVHELSRFWIQSWFRAGKRSGARSGGWRPSWPRPAIGLKATLRWPGANTTPLSWP